MVYLTTDDVIEFCRIGVAYAGGSFALLDRGKLESAVNGVQASFDGDLLLKSIEEVAAGYWFGICQAHAFMDGNKRAALLSVDMFLQMNGNELDMSSSEAEAVTLRIASGDIRSREALYTILRIRPTTPETYG